MEDFNFLVRVSCMTYNQAHYIVDAMNGFCMQETFFPFVCTIVDDASTDGEPEVIHDYLNKYFILDGNEDYHHNETEDYVRVFARHKTNSNCYFVVVYLKYNHYSIQKPKAPYIKEWTNTKYIALCEGDDYWIDPMKLQKQFAFMEIHPQHSLCFCAHKTLSPNGETKEVYRYVNDREECPMQDIIMGGGGYMATNTMFYRKNLYVPYTTWIKNSPVGDGPMMLSLASKGYVAYLSDIMSVYRVLAKESWSQRMRASRKLRYKHYIGVINIWHKFDAWTEGRYHNIIVKKIKKNRKQFFRHELYLLISSFRRK